MSSIDVTIPIRPYLKKFLSKNARVDPYFTLSLYGCHVSAIIFECFKEDWAKVSHESDRYMTDKLSIHMPTTVTRYKRFYVDDALVYTIDKRLKSMFDQQLMDYSIISHGITGKLKQSMITFLDFYGINEDDVSLEALYRYFYRTRKKQNSGELIREPRTLLMPGQELPKKKKKAGHARLSENTLGLEFED